MTREELERKVAVAIKRTIDAGGGFEHMRERVAQECINVVLEASAEMVTDEGYRPFLHADGTVCAIGGSTDAVARIRRAITAKNDEAL